MDATNLKLRAATKADAPALLNWRNDPLTRANSRNTEPVSFEQHEVWLSRMLNSSEHVVRIAEAYGEPVGVVLASRTAKGWELSWTVAPGARGRGLGSRMLSRFIESLDGHLIAVIRKDNRPSRKIAARAGLKRIGDARDLRFDLWTRE